MVFHSLSREQVTRIVDLQLDRLRTRLTDQGVSLAVNEAARRALAVEGYDPLYGARPVRRAIQRHVETPAAERIVAGLPPGADLSLTWTQGAGFRLAAASSEVSPSALSSDKPTPAADLQTA